jgi:hypothetical protein
MAFAWYKTLKDTAREYDVKFSKGAVPQFARRPDNSLKEELESNRTYMRPTSEPAIDAFLVAPVLRKVWLPYKDSLTLWSHEPLKVRELLKGVPDYFFTKCATFTGPVQDKPYVFVVEATSKNDHDEGWAHCLAAMLAMQKLNEPSKLPLVGAVSNGTTWSFGMLEDQTLNQVMEEYSTGDLPALLGVLDALMVLAKDRAFEG